MPTRWAAAYWREQTKAGKDGQGLDHQHVVDVGAVRQRRPDQLRRGQVRHRHVLPDLRQGAEPLRRARQRHRPGGADPAHAVDPRPRGGIASPRQPPFDVWDPANISPLVAHLATADCPFTGATFYVQGGMVKVYKSWELGDGVDQDARWSVADWPKPCAPSPTSPTSAPPTSPRSRPTRAGPAERAPARPTAMAPGAQPPGMSCSAPRPVRRALLISAASIWAVGVVFLPDSSGGITAMDQEQGYILADRTADYEYQKLEEAGSTSGTKARLLRSA